MHDPLLKKPRVLRGIIVLAAVFVVAGLACIGFLNQRIMEPIVQGPGVTRIGYLSDYLPNLASTPAQNSEVYYLDSGKPGATVLIYSSHPCEPSPLLEATMIIEKAKVSTGRLIVIPRAVRSGYEDMQPGLGYIERYHITQPGGTVRWFRNGGRTTAQRLQWPLPTIAAHYPSKQTLADMESLNLNRCMPGRPDGTLTERTAYAICEIIRKEKVLVVIDNHEAPPDRPLVEAVCVSQETLPLGAESVLNLELNYGIKWRLELSPVNLRGLSHQEISRATDALAMLHETASPMHGPISGMKTEALLLTGWDEYELRAAKAKRVFCQYDEKGKPIELRVGQKIAFLASLQEAINANYPDQQLVVENLPSFDDILANGVGAYLAVVNEPEPKQYLIKYLF